MERSGGYPPLRRSRRSSIATALRRRTRFKRCRVWSRSTAAPGSWALRSSGPPWGLRGALVGYVELIRGTPILLQLFVLYYGIAAAIRLPAFAAALIGLALNYAAYESEIYRGALEAVPTGQLEAARTLGLSERQVLTLVRGPQAFRLALAPMTNDFVALLKDSSLVSVRHVQVTGVHGPEAGAIRAALVAAARRMTTLDVRSGTLRSAVTPFPTRSRGLR